MDIPIIDVAPLLSDGAGAQQVAEQIGQACRDNGFFYIAGHGVSSELQDRLESLSRQFFAQDLESKLRIRMQLAGRAWRGYFPVGDELTSGKPDQKEGIYFGAEHPADHARVRAGVPLFGANLFPDLPGFRRTVLEYMAALTSLCHGLMQGISLSLGLDREHCRQWLTSDPTILFRIFHYPSLRRTPDIEDVGCEQWSVGEHTDYGLLTVLRQDQTGGLQVKSRDRWIEAPPIADSFVCNIGDMLDRMTGGLYRSTPHRVRNLGPSGRLSFPFFFDPSWDAQVQPLCPDRPAADDARSRWDGVRLHDLQGAYGDYLLQKVAKVFPELSGEQL